MTPADQQRLELARRAFRAAEPSAVEVQTGVRRARLQLVKRKRSRTWFGKGLVLVVLAVGGLAYANPQALSQLVERVVPGRSDRPLLKAPREKTADLLTQEMPARRVGQSSPSNPRAALAGQSPPASLTTAPAKIVSERTANLSSRVGTRRDMSKTRADAHGQPDGYTKLEAPAEEASDWSRVGRALASGDEARALAALNQLSQSQDRVTRDKADLGRAQLLMAHGELQSACSLARSLTERQAQEQIERQARSLLNGCPR